METTARLLPTERTSRFASTGRGTFLPALDGVRFLAFLAVFLFHVPLNGVWGLAVFNRIGWIGVEIFFVISGYLLFRLFAEEFQHSGKIDIRKYFARRILRLYPAVVVFAVLATAVDLSFGRELSGWSLARLAGILTFTDNIFAAFVGFDNSIPYTAHLGTIAFEFQVYLVIPLLFIASRKLAFSRFALCLVGLWLAAMGLRWVAISLNAPHPVIWVIPFFRPESIFAGILLAMNGFRLGVVTACALAVVLSTGIYLAPPKGVGSFDMLIYPMVGALGYIVVGMSLTYAPLTAVLARRPIRWLGRISYSLYLYHLAAIVVGMSAATVVLRDDGAWTKLAGGSTALIVTIFLATLSYEVVEKPFLRLKSHLRSESRATS